MEERKHKNSFISRFLPGLCGGVLGAFLVMGGFYLANGANSPVNNSNTTSNSKAGTTQVSNVKVNAESDVSAAVEKVQGAVVSVINLQQQQANSNDPFGGLFGNQQNDSEANNTNADDSGLQEAGEGSGVIYKKNGNDAYVVTNNHVVDGAAGLEVVLKDGTKVKGELVGTDSYTDLAVIKIDGSKVDTVATFGDSEALKVGEPAIAIGSPLGSAYANSVTSGVVSAKARTMTDENTGINATVIQTDAAINPGNSGGPLINIAGQVIGINSSKLASTQTSTSTIAVEGMGFAIPSNDVVKIIDQLEQNGKVVRPALGVGTYDLTDISAQQQEKILKVPADVTTGVVIGSVTPAMPAEKAGLKQYDIITEIDGEAVTNNADLKTALYKKKVGDTIEVTYYREGKKETAKVELSVDTSAIEKQQQSQNNRGSNG